MTVTQVALLEVDFVSLLVVGENLDVSFYLVYEVILHVVGSIILAFGFQVCLV